MTAAVLAEPASSTAPHGERSAGCLCHHLQDGRTHSSTGRVTVTSAAVHPPPGNLLTAQNNRLPATPNTTLDEDVSLLVSRRARPPSSYGNGLSKSIQCKRLLRDVKDPRHFWGKHHSRRQQSRRGAVTRCQRHARRPTACEGKLQTPAQMCVVINKHTHTHGHKEKERQQLSGERGGFVQY